MSIKGPCQTCGHARSLESCIGCGRSVCEEHRGDEGGGYWNASGKKGFGCGRCIKDATVYEGGAFGSICARVHGIEVSIRHVDEYLTSRLIADVQVALAKTVTDALGGKTMDGFTRDTIHAAERALGRQVHGAEQHASNLVTHSVEQAKALVSHAVSDLSSAITHHRAALIEVDVEKLAATLEKRLGPLAADIRRETAATRRTAVMIGLAIAAANFLGIWIGSIVAHAR